MAYKTTGPTLLGPLILYPRPGGPASPPYPSLIMTVLNNTGYNTDDDLYCF